MTRDVVVVPPELSLKAARLLMQDRNIRHLPVVRAGRLIGILSDRDILLRTALLDAPERGPSCGEAMTPAPVTCAVTTPIGQVAALMLEHKIDSLPVVAAEGVLVGLVTSSDLIALLVDRDEIQPLPFDFRLRITDQDGALLASA